MARNPSVGFYPPSRNEQLPSGNCSANRGIRVIVRAHLGFEGMDAQEAYCWTVHPLLCEVARAMMTLSA